MTAAPEWVITGGATSEMFYPRPTTVPAPAMMGAGNTYVGNGERFIRRPDGSKVMGPDVRQLTPEEAAILQTYPARPERPAPMTDLVALDLFAGHGWGVACRRLGIQEYGVEIMPEAVATREANGMRTIYRDVWDGLIEPRPGLIPDELREERQAAIGRALDPKSAWSWYDLLIASPPCQTFSVAGKGAGRAALDEVLQAIAERDYLDPAALKAFGERHDDRTALVLSPLAYIARDLPRLVVLEQVPTVRPVWEAYADVMREWGYSVAVDVLNAEQYGVPQTRKRAILVARWDGEAKMPTPTHSRYHPRTPEKLDPDVLPWVSMAEALGWGMTARPYLSVATGTGAGGGTDPAALGGSHARAQLVAEREAGRWVKGDDYAEGGALVMRSNYNTGHGDNAGERGERDGREPAPTMTSKANRNMWVQERHRGAGMLERHGERPARPVGHPALTITGNASGTTPGGFAVRPDWTEERPATTIQGDSQVWPPGHKVNADDEARLGQEAARERYGDRAGSGATRVTIDEAAALQSYPEGFRFEGNKGKQFLQVGNAVPPLLAEAVLREMLS